MRMGQGDLRDGVRYYGSWRAGGRNGVPENVTKCIEEVSDHDSRWPHYYQCKNKRGHGKNGLYCKRHDPDEVSRRDNHKRRKWDAASAVDSARHARAVAMDALATAVLMERRETLPETTRHMADKARAADERLAAAKEALAKL